MKTVMLIWQRMMMRRIRMRRIEPSGPPHAHTTTTNLIPITTALAVSHHPANVRRGGGTTTLPAPPPPNEEPLRIITVALEQNDVAGVKTLVLHVTAPPLGENIALAAVPVRVTEPPALPRLVLETQ